jgi:hypothetical protein
MEMRSGLPLQVLMALCPVRGQGSYILAATSLSALSICHLVSIPAIKEEGLKKGRLPLTKDISRKFHTMFSFTFYWLKPSQAPVAYTCNPSYSGDRDQEDSGLKPVWANSSTRPYFEKNPSQKRAGGVVQGVGFDFKPQYHKNE